MDLLKERVEFYIELINTEYYIKFGKKSKITNVKIYFSKYEFIHLLGLHKLKDIDEVFWKPEEFIEDVLNDKLTFDYIKKSMHYHEIEQRFLQFIKIKTIIEDESTVFKIIKRKKHSKIDMDFIMILKNDELDSYNILCLKAENNKITDNGENNYDCFGVSYIVNEDVSYYSDGHTKLNTLLKEKYIKPTETNPEGTKIIIYQNPNYKNQTQNTQIKWFVCF